MGRGPRRDVVARALVLAAILWPVVLGAAWWGRAGGVAGAEPWSALVYAAASRICHQKPERSFHAAGTSWPVCGRCSGLYLAAPIGAALAGAHRRRWQLPARPVLAAAALPTAVTLGLEWAGVPITNALRAAAALPLGAAVAAVLADVATGGRRPIK
jgi:uncharacterized membrane protein